MTREEEKGVERGGKRRRNEGNTGYRNTEEARGGKKWKE